MTEEEGEKEGRECHSFTVDESTTFGYLLRLADFATVIHHVDFRKDPVSPTPCFPAFRKCTSPAMQKTYFVVIAYWTSSMEVPSRLEIISIHLEGVSRAQVLRDVFDTSSLHGVDYVRRQLSYVSELSDLAQTKIDLPSRRP